jgi:hypothetical protein
MLPNNANSVHVSPVFGIVCPVCGAGLGKRCITDHGNHEARYSAAYASPKAQNIAINIALARRVKKQEAAERGRRNREIRMRMIAEQEAQISPLLRLARQDVRLAFIAILDNVLAA